MVPEERGRRRVLARENGGSPRVSVGGGLELKRRMNLADEVDGVGELGLERNLRGFWREGFGFSSGASGGVASATVEVEEEEILP